MLNAHGVRSSVCSVDNMRAIRIHYEPRFLRERDEGFQQIESASRLVIRQNAFAHSRALSRILAYQHLDYIFCSCTACSLTQGCTVLFFDAGFATLRRLREQLQQPDNHLRLKISSALRRLARRLASSSLSKNFGTRFTTSNRSFRGRQRFPATFP